MAPGFTPVGGAITIPVGGADTSSSAPASQPSHQNGSIVLSSTLTALGAPTTAVAALPLAANTVLPAGPNLPDDPVIPHNGFQTIEEGEKAFTHLLRKAGVDANWTWDQTMRAIITDPLYKALNSLAEKKPAGRRFCFLFHTFTTLLFTLLQSIQQASSKRNMKKRKLGLPSHGRPSGICLKEIPMFSIIPRSAPQTSSSRSIPSGSKLELNLSLS
jgi:hypothetical protein